MPPFFSLDCLFISLCLFFFFFPFCFASLCSVFFFLVLGFVLLASFLFFSFSCLVSLLFLLEMNLGVCFLPFLFPCVSWKEQLQNIQLDRFLSPIFASLWFLKGHLTWLLNPQSSVGFCSFFLGGGDLLLLVWFVSLFVSFVLDYEEPVFPIYNGYFCLFLSASLCSQPHFSRSPFEVVFSMSLLFLCCFFLLSFLPCFFYPSLLVSRLFYDIYCLFFWSLAS